MVSLVLMSLSSLSLSTSIFRSHVSLQPCPRGWTSRCAVRLGCWDCLLIRLRQERPRLDGCHFRWKELEGSLAAAGARAQDLAPAGHRGRSVGFLVVPTLVAALPFRRSNCSSCPPSLSSRHRSSCRSDRLCGHLRRIRPSIPLRRVPPSRRNLSGSPLLLAVLLHPLRPDRRPSSRLLPSPLHSMVLHRRLRRTLHGPGRRALLREALLGADRRPRPKQP
mmetsp:Transcript_5009/g.12602  ORF Transcript_5009/g.12602 Transcript_5009/m.12602 type:complete len:221 (-) Transcript_5009:1345-2007(-)